MGIDPYRHLRQKNWRYIYTRSDKLHRAKQLGQNYPRQSEAELLHQEAINVLFVCTMNRWRSPTAEKVYANHPLLHSRSRGTSRKAKRPVTADDIKWADVIFVMEEKHRQQLQSWFPGEVTYAEIHVLGIPDDYQLMDPELIQWIRDAVDDFL